MDPIKVAIIGVGHIAQDAHMPALRGLPGVCVVALCDVNEEILARVARTTGVTATYPDPRRLAEAAEFDCGYVLTRPHSTHAAIAAALLESGRDVMCEKPMATTLSDAQRMLEAAARSRRILMIGFNRRFMPVCRKAKALFRDRRLDVCRITYAGPLRPFALLENPHAVDLLRYFANAPVRRLQATGHLADGGDDRLVAHIEFESGAVGVLIAHHGAGGFAETVELHGEGLSVLADLHSQTLRYQERPRDLGMRDPQAWTEYRPSKLLGYPELLGYSALNEEFIDCVRTRRQPVFHAESAYESHRLVHAIYEAAGLPTF